MLIATTRLIKVKIIYMLLYHSDTDLCYYWITRIVDAIFKQLFCVLLARWVVAHND